MKNNAYWRALTGRNNPEEGPSDTVEITSSNDLTSARKCLYVDRNDYYVWPLLMSAYAHPELVRGLPSDQSSLILGSGIPYTGTTIIGGEIVAGRSGYYKLQYVPTTLPAPTHWVIDFNTDGAKITNDVGLNKFIKANAISEDTGYTIYPDWDDLPFVGAFRVSSPAARIEITTAPVGYPYAHARKIAGENSAIQRLLIRSGYLSPFLSAKDDSAAMACVACAMIYDAV